MKKHYSTLILLAWCIYPNAHAEPNPEHGQKVYKRTRYAGCRELRGNAEEITEKVRSILKVLLRLKKRLKK